MIHFPVAVNATTTKKTLVNAEQSEVPSSETLSGIGFEMRYKLLMELAAREVSEIRRRSELKKAQYSHRSDEEIAAR